MKLIIIFCLILLMLAGAINEKRFYAPAFFFPAWWTLISILTELKLYSLNDVSDGIFGIVLVGCVSFYCGILVANRKTFVIGRRSDRNCDITYSARKMVVLALYGISLFLFSIIAIQSVKLLLSGYSMEYIRSVWQGDGSETTGGFNIIQSGLYSYICCPFVYAIVPYTTFRIIQRTIRMDELVLFFLLLVLYIVGCGGRIIIVYFLMSIIIHYQVSKVGTITESNEGIIRTKRNRGRMLLLLGGGVVAFVLMSQSRGVTDFYRSIYTYICGCMPHFEYQVGLLKNDDVMFYGMATLKGFLLPVFSLMNAVGIMKYPIWFKNMLTYVTLQDRVVIGQNLSINAFVTSFFAPYADFRIPGVIVAMILYAYICQKSYRNMLAKPNDQLCGSMYVLLFFGLATSMIRLQFSATNYAYSIIILRMMFNKRNDL